MRERIVVVLVVFAQLSGCRPLLGGGEGLAAGAAYAAERDGLLVGSVTNPDPHIGAHADIRFFFRSADGKHRFDVANAPHAGWRSGATRDSDPGLEVEAGKRFAIPVRPGEYELYRASIWLQFSADVLFRPAPRVLVGPGEVVYVGSLDVTNCYSLYVAPDGARRRSGIVGGLVDVRDARGRDLPALRQKFPEIRERAIVARVFDGAALKASGAAALAKDCRYELGGAR